MGVQIRWVRCKCGKLHTASDISTTSRCSCGELLYEQMWVKGR